MAERQPSGLARTAGEGGVFGAAAVVAAQVASSHFPETEGVGVLAAALVGGGGAWLASVGRNLSSDPSTPSWVKVILGAK